MSILREGKDRLSMISSFPKDNTLWTIPDFATANNLEVAKIFEYK